MVGGQYRYALKKPIRRARTQKYQIWVKQSCPVKLGELGKPGEWGLQPRMIQSAERAMGGEKGRRRGPKGDKVLRLSDVTSRGGS